jgi:hypothetical protein
VPIKDFEFEFEFILKSVVCNLNKIICLLDLFVRLEKEEKMWINVCFISFSIDIKIYIFVYLPQSHLKQVNEMIKTGWPKCSPN